MTAGSRWREKYETLRRMYVGGHVSLVCILTDPSLHRDKELRSSRIIKKIIIITIIIIIIIIIIILFVLFCFFVIIMCIFACHISIQDRAHGPLQLSIYTHIINPENTVLRSGLNT